MGRKSAQLGVHFTASADVYRIFGMCVFSTLCFVFRLVFSTVFDLAAITDSLGCDGLMEKIKPPTFLSPGVEAAKSKNKVMAQQGREDTSKVV